LRKNGAKCAQIAMSPIGPAAAAAAISACAAVLSDLHCGVVWRKM
jgi:hypothetical protein